MADLLAHKDSYSFSESPPEPRARFDVASTPPDSSSQARAWLLYGIQGTAAAAAFVVAVSGRPEPAETQDADWAISGLLADDPAAQPMPITRLADELAALKKLPQGWDGEGSVPPLAKALDDAKAFLDLLPPRAKLPRPIATADGEIELYWRTPTGYIDIGFGGDETISYFARADGYPPRSGTVSFTGKSIPKNLLEVISTI